MNYLIVLIFFYNLINNVISINYNRNSDRYDIVYSLEQKQYYVIYNNYYSLLTNDYTIQVMRESLTSIDDLEEIPPNIQDTSILDSFYTKADPFPGLNLHINSSYDLTIKSAMKYLQYLFHGERSPLYDIKTIDYKDDDGLKNVAIAPVDDIYLAVYKHGFFWLNNKLEYNHRFNSQQQHLEYTNKIIPEEDQRIFRLSNGDYVVVYTAQIFGRQYDVKMGMRYLTRQQSDHQHIRFDVSNGIILFFIDDFYNNKEKNVEKNWSPFNYDNNVYFIQSFQPFHIIQIDFKLSKHPKALQYHGLHLNGYILTNVSLVDCPLFRWSFGHIRGGTPALLVRNEYLGFFHSNIQHGGIERLLPGVPEQTRIYSIGAYTFTRHPPFRITGISRFPLTHESFEPYYDSNDHHPRYDLVVFVMSYFIANVNGKVIIEGQEEDDEVSTVAVLTIGINDDRTIISKINLNDVYDSMKPLSC